MPAIIQFRDSYHPGFSLETLKLEYIRPQFYQFYMCMKCGLINLREEKKLRVFQNKMLRKIFGPKKRRTDR